MVPTNNLYRDSTITIIRTDTIDNPKRHGNKSY
jgi:hypothetical protein